MGILLGELNAKVRREDIFRQTIWNDSLHETSNDSLYFTNYLDTGFKEPRL
jgi:hypothetical protein